MPFRRYVFVLGVLAAPVLEAATEFETGVVPLEFARQMIGGAIYRSLPDGFPVVALPAGTDVRLLGSAKRHNNHDAILSTTQDPDALRAILTAAYVAAGWVDLSATMAPSLSRLCHDELGYVAITRTTPTFNGLRMTHSPGYFAAGQTCATMAAAGANPWASYFSGLMPVLSAPPQATPAGSLTPNVTSMSIRGNRVELAREGIIDVPDINIAGLYAHFAARLVEQGWINDSEDSGLKSAASVWYKTAAPPEGVDADDTQLTGFLTILHTGGEDYRVAFSLEATTDADLSPGIYFAVPYDIMGNGERPPLNDPQLGIRGIPTGYTPR